jgi:CBS-domain-containing membrane protein
MLVEDVMTAHPVTVTEAATVQEALQLLDTYSVTSLPVVDAAGRIRGVVSEADLIRDRILPDPIHREAPGFRQPTPLPLVGDVCTRHAVTAHPHDDLADVVDLLTSTAIKSVPVVDRKGVVLGVLSRSDVVHVLARTDAGDDDGA